METHRDTAWLNEKNAACGMTVSTTGPASQVAARAMLAPNGPGFQDTDHQPSTWQPTQATTHNDCTLRHLGAALFERSSDLPERSSNLPERSLALPERSSNLPERSSATMHLCWRGFG